MLCSAGGSLSLLPPGENRRRYLRSRETKEKGADEESSQAGDRLPWFGADKDDLLRPESMPKALRVNEDIGSGNGRFLRIAARNGQIDIVKDLLDQGFNISTTGNSSGPLSGQPTPIEVAAAAGHSDIVELFLDRGANLGKVLQLAVRNQEQAVIRLLLDKRPHISIDKSIEQNWNRYNRRRLSGESAIALAVEWNFPHILEVLLDHANKRSNPEIGLGMVVAARKGNLPLLRSILKGFQLMGVQEGDSLTNEYYAFVEATYEAALNRDMM
ncbi:hypothetical protein VTN77DRAFT_7416 [Rasamsonia byssochlamydoides]|uniref:uncharacterized protein n=1 Tax=Rasamsonia byssochlamydoides TaxID=89139 RepID=UPI003743E879